MYYMKKCILDQISRKLTDLERLYFYQRSQDRVFNYVAAIKNNQKLKESAIKVIKEILDKGFCPVKTLIKNKSDDIILKLLEDPSIDVKSIFAFWPHEAINKKTEIGPSRTEGVEFLTFLNKAIEYMIINKKVQEMNDLIETKCNIF